MKIQELTFVEAHLFKLARAIVRILCKQFDLRCRALHVFDPDDPDKRENCGVCYIDGTIVLNLRKGEFGKFESVDELIDTVIHEVAHLKHQGHGKKFWAFHRKMKKWFKANYVNPKESRL